MDVDSPYTVESKHHDFLNASPNNELKMYQRVNEESKKKVANLMPKVGSVVKKYYQTVSVAVW